MPPTRRGAVVALAAACLSSLPLAAVPARVDAAGGPSVGSCPLFPVDNVWNTDISSLPVNARSADWIASSGGSGRLIHPDWGPSGGSVAYGIPWQLVDASHPKVTVTFQYADESDPGPYPLGPDTPIEGGGGTSGDRHALVVDQSTCTLYETYATEDTASGWTAGSGAVFSLTSNALRPAGWTSADAAGLPILPGLVRYSELKSGAIRHAIRFTVQQTDRSYLWPARHYASSTSDPTLPPMGARFRLKSGVDISHFSPDTRVVLTAMQHYGLIVADNGSNWYFQGDTDPGWSSESTVISELKTIPAGDFEAVDESSLMISSDSAQARQPSAPRSIPPVHLATPTPRPPAAATPTPAPSATPSPSPSPSPSDVAVAIAVTPSPSESSTPGSQSDRGALLDTGIRGGGGGPPAAVAGALTAGGVLLLAGGGMGLVARRRRRRRATR